MTMAVEDISPRIAGEYLLHNDKNRSIRTHHLRHLARQMSEGLWVYNADPIRFNGKTLIDGQHRLMAVVDTGRTIKMLVVRGLSDEAQLTIDSGRNRSNADTLSMRGHTYAHTAAGTLRLVDAYVNGRMNTLSHYRVSNAEILLIERRHPLAMGASQYVVQNMPAGWGYRTVPALVYYVAGFVDEDARETFFTQVFHGVGIDSKNEPSWLLRQRLEKHARGDHRLGQRAQLGIYIRAWNHFISGNKLGLLKYSVKHPLPNFEPLPKGLPDFRGHEKANRP